MRHVAARVQYAALSQLGITPPRLLPWRAHIVLRQRSWASLRPWQNRAVTAHVVCPSTDVPGGHLVLTAEGSYVHTDALVEVDGPFELVPYSAPPPAARRRGKQPDVRTLSSVTPSVDAPRRGGGVLDEFLRTDFAPEGFFADLTDPPRVVSGHVPETTTSPFGGGVEDTVFTDSQAETSGQVPKLPAHSGERSLRKRVTWEDAAALTLIQSELYGRHRRKAESEHPVMRH